MLALDEGVVVQDGSDGKSVGQHLGEATETGANVIGLAQNLGTSAGVMLGGLGGAGPVPQPPNLDTADDQSIVQEIELPDHLASDWVKDVGDAAKLQSDDARAATDRELELALGAESESAFEGDPPDGWDTDSALDLGSRDDGRDLDLGSSDAGSDLDLDTGDAGSDLDLGSGDDSAGEDGGGDTPGFGF